MASVTCGADTISINFTHGELYPVTDTLKGELGGISASGWTNVNAANTTGTTVNNQDGISAGIISISDVNNSWRSNVDTGDTLTSVVQKGYLDCPKGNPGKVYTIAVDHDYWLSDVTFYMSGDTDNAPYASLNVNGTSYKGGETVTTGSGTWGGPGNPAGVTEYGIDNSMTVTGTIGDLVVKNEYIDGSDARATLAGLQIKDVTATKGYFTTLTEGTTAAADAEWSNNGAVVSYGSITTAQKNLGITAAGAGSTLQLSDGEKVASIAAVANTLTIDSEGTVAIDNLHTYDGANLILNANLETSSLSATGNGSITIGSTAKTDILNIGANVTITGNVTAGTVNLYNEANPLTVSEKGTLTITGGNKLDVGSTLTKITGKGTIEVTTNAFIKGNTRRDYWGNLVSNPVAPTATQFEGDLIISNGARLDIGHDASGHQWGYYTDLSSLRSLQLNDAYIHYNGEENVIKSLVINTASATDDRLSTIHVENMGEGQRIKFNSVTLNADLNLTSYWASRIDMDALTGKGNLHIKSTGESNAKSDLNVTVVDGYTGVISFMNGADGNNDSTSGLTADITIAKNATLVDTQLVNNTSAATVTLMGEGTYKVTAPGTAINNGLTASTWTGTVSMSNVTSEAAISLGAYGNKDSKISLSSVSAKLNGGTVDSAVEFNTNNGFSLKAIGENNGKDITFSNTVKGTGFFCIETTVPSDANADSPASYKADTYTFKGDTSEWTGKLITGNNAYTNVVYDGTSAINNEIDATKGGTMNVTIVNQSGVTVGAQVHQHPWTSENAGTINLKLENKSTESTGAVQFTKTVNVNSTTLGAGTTATFEVASNLGSLTLGNGASITATGDLTIGALTLDIQNYTTDFTQAHTLVSTTGTLNFTGDLTSYTSVQVGTYTATVTKNDNSLVLSFTAIPSEPNTFGVIGFGGYDSATDMLTLKVDANLANYDFTLNGAIVIPGISDGIMAEIEELTKGLKDSMVGITLMDENGNSISASGETQIGFLGNDGESVYWGKNVGTNGWQYNAHYIPEPTTATLSLLALAGLAARRRRK